MIKEPQLSLDASRSDDYAEDFKDEVLKSMTTFSDKLKKFLQKAYKLHGAEREAYIRDRIKTLEEDKETFLSEWLSKAEDDLYLRGHREAIRFRLRLFDHMYRRLLSKDNVVGPVFDAYMRRSKRQSANMDFVLDMQYIAWEILKNPSRFEDRLKELRVIVGNISKALCNNCNGQHLLPDFDNMENGILAYAATRALLEEEGFYVATPPAPELDTDWSIDLIAINQREMLDAIDAIDMNKEERSGLIENVGTHNEGSKNSWTAVLGRYPQLQAFVTLVQVKSHAGTKYRASNKTIKDAHLEDTFVMSDKMIPDNMSDSVIKGKELRDVLIRGIGGNILIKAETLRNIILDFSQMRRILPEAKLLFVDMSRKDSIMIIRRRI